MTSDPGRRGQGGYRDRQHRHAVVETSLGRQLGQGTAQGGFRELAGHKKKLRTRHDNYPGPSYRTSGGVAGGFQGGEKCWRPVESRRRWLAMPQSNKAPTPHTTSPSRQSTIISTPYSPLPRSNSAP